VQLVVGRIAKAHGIGGEVAVEVRTDSPEDRFAPDTPLETDPPERGPLTIVRTRWHAGRLLVVDSATSPPTGEDEYWDHDLDGLDVVTVDGEALGVVTEVLHPPGSDVLAVRRGDGSELLVPFVRAIVPTVDLAARRVVVDPPEGLLEL
jgi:16S rRNA processing protein RimM